MLTEIWTDVKGLEGLYQVSNTGKIKSLSRSVNCNGGITVLKERILKQETTRLGYVRVCMYKNELRIRKLVHVLVADAFVIRQQCGLEVNHINGVKSDNRSENLEWTTKSNNMKHAFLLGLKKGNFGTKNHASRLVININTGIYYDTIKEASESSNYEYHYIVNNLIQNKKNKTPFRYAD